MPSFRAAPQHLQLRGEGAGRLAGSVEEPLEWMAENKIRSLCIAPGSPWQNGCIESFNARLREECLNRERLWNLTEARVVLEDWVWNYNNIRPHRSLGYITPIRFAQKEQESKPAQCQASLLPGIYFLCNLKHTVNTPD